MKTFTRYLFALIGLLGPIPVQAQPVGDTLWWEGEYELGDFGGKAEYAFWLRGVDTVRDGHFHFRGADPQALLRGGDSYLGVSGTYADGKLSGPWRYELGVYTVSGTAEVIDYQYHLDVDGEQRLAWGQLTDGRPDGSWTVESRRIEGSAPTATTFRSAFTFAAGVPQQSFRLERPGAALLGRFKRDGVAHDTWTLYADFTARQNWNFRDGLLTGIEVFQNNDTINLPVFAAGAYPMSPTTLDGAYLRLVDAWQRMQGIEPGDLGGPAPELLEANAARYREIGEVMAELGAPAFTPAFRVMVPDFPLAAGEADQLDSLTIYMQEIDTLSQSLLANTAYRIVENSDPAVGYLRDVIALIVAEWTPHLRAAAQAHREGILAHLPRGRYFAALWPSRTDRGRIARSHHPSGQYHLPGLCRGAPAHLRRERRYRSHTTIRPVYARQSPGGECQPQRARQYRRAPGSPGRARE